MGLRCSLFGHDFGDTLTERNRNEEGAEVVITVRKIRSCRRCGAEEIVAENTEIRHRDSLAESSTPEKDPDKGPPTEMETTGQAVENEDAPESAPEHGRRRQSAPDANVDDETEPTVPDLVESAEPTDAEKRWEHDTGRDGDVDEGNDNTDVVDDGIIMNESLEGDVDRESDLGRRELVDSGNMFDTSAPEAGNGDDVVGRDRNAGVESESTDSQPDDENEKRNESGADFIEAGPSEDRNAEGSAGTSFEFEDGEPSGERSREKEPDLSGSGITAAGPLDVSGSPNDDLDATFVCPACRYSAKAAGSSLRAGDICPNCHKGYLAERR